jgi:hypothetical protein
MEEGGNAEPWFTKDCSVRVCKQSGREREVCWANDAAKAAIHYLCMFCTPVLMFPEGGRGELKQMQLLWANEYCDLSGGFTVQNADRALPIHETGMHLTRVGG